MRLVDEIIEQRVARNLRHNDRYVRTVVGSWRVVRYTHSLAELLLLGRMVSWWLFLVGQRGCVLVGVRYLCSLWQSTGGSTRHWKEAASEAAIHSGGSSNSKS